MRGNVVVAAVVFGIGMIVASLIFVLGLRVIVDSAVQRLDASVQAHGERTERAGVAAGGSIHDSIAGLSGTMDKHAGAVLRAGDVIAHPLVAMKGPVDVVQPIRIEGSSAAVTTPIKVQGSREDGALPVNARIAK
jgi:hypothetical protein